MTGERRLEKVSEYLFLWALGGTIYYEFEMIFRGFSHWSMFVLGGICLCFIAWQGKMVHWRDPLWRQTVRCVIFVAAGEFFTGIIVNKWLRLNVWDYSDQPMQLFGQVCVPFLIIFSGLCVIGIFLSSFLLHILYGEEKPSFHILQVQFSAVLHGKALLKICIQNYREIAANKEHFIF